MTILIVEDNDQVRQVIRELLGDLVGQYHECEDGAEALAAYELWRPDWVLMDLRMKGVDGLSATQQILAAHPEARICIVTDYDAPELRQAATVAGASGYVVKHDLLALRRLLGIWTGRSATEEI